MGPSQDAGLGGATGGPGAGQPPLGGDSSQVARSGPVSWEMREEGREVTEQRPPPPAPAVVPGAMQCGFPAEAEKADASGEVWPLSLWLHGRRPWAPWPCLSPEPMLRFRSRNFVGGGNPHFRVSLTSPGFRSLSHGGKRRLLLVGPGLQLHGLGVEVS